MGVNNYEYVSSGQRRLYSALMGVNNYHQDRDDYMPSMGVNHSIQEWVFIIFRFWE